MENILAKSRQSHKHTPQPGNLHDMDVASPATVEDAAARPAERKVSTCGDDSTAFECNICESPACLIGAHAEWMDETGKASFRPAGLDLAREPVVTLCGHLYCWSCLYRWTTQLPIGHATPTRGPSCPVCKAPVECDRVVPIYGRGSELDPRMKAAQQPVPPRPAGQRPVIAPVGMLLLI